VASYDASTGKLTWDDQAAARPRVIDNAWSDKVFGRDAWKWMLLQPALPTQR
jgi:hypothetical protein